MKIEGQAAIVTGGASGLGAAAARALAARGAKPVLLDFNLAGAESLAADLDGLAIQCDVSSAQSVEAAFAAIPPARILVNCAGVAPARRIVGKDGPMSLDEFRRVIEVNLIGSFNTLRLFAAQAMVLDPLEDGERAIAINTASVAAFEGQLGQAAYAASKGGVASLTLPAAREFAPRGIRVMAIAPGTFETPMMAGMPDAVREALAADTPFPKRLGKPEEYAALAVHIVENTMLNGEVIRLDGALRMKA